MPGFEAQLMKSKPPVALTNALDARKRKTIQWWVSVVSKTSEAVLLYALSTDVREAHHRP